MTTTTSDTQKKLAFPNPSLAICAPVGFFIVSEMYCLNGSPDLYVSTTSWGVVELSNGFDCIAPKAVVAKPRTRIIALSLELVKFFFLISAPTTKPPSHHDSHSHMLLS